MAVQRLIDALRTRLQFQHIEMNDAWWAEHRRILWDYSAVMKLFERLDEQSKQERNGAAKQEPQPHQLAYGFIVTP